MRPDEILPSTTCHIDKVSFDEVSCTDFMPSSIKSTLEAMAC